MLRLGEMASFVQLLIMKHIIGGKKLTAEKRNNARTTAALDRLKQSAEQVKNGDGDLMPAIIESFRCDATLGETMGGIASSL